MSRKTLRRTTVATAVMDATTVAAITGGVEFLVITVITNVTITDSVHEEVYSLMRSSPVPNF